jgi:uncharacterized protein YodC (DUF2158 family)
MKTQFLKAANIYCAFLVLSASSNLLAGPYDCKWFYEGSIELEVGYIEQLFTGGDSASLAFLLG